MGKYKSAFAQALGEIMGIRVARSRIELGWSQKEFARRLGWAQGYLSRVESGKLLVRSDKLKELGQTLRVSCDWLLGRELYSHLEYHDLGREGFEEQACRILRAKIEEGS